MKGKMSVSAESVNRNADYVYLGVDFGNLVMQTLDVVAYDSSIVGVAPQ